MTSSKKNLRKRSVVIGKNLRKRPGAKQSLGLLHVLVLPPNLAALRTLALSAILLLVLALSGCSANAAETVDAQATSTGGASTSTRTPSASTTATSNDDDEDDATVTRAQTIDQDGTYTLTGIIDGQVLVTAENVTLILDGATITCADGSAILGKDGNGEEVEQELVVELRGENTVTSGAKHGIQCKDNLTITGTGSVAISAATDGLHAGEALTVAGGTVNVVESYEGMEAPTILISGGDSTLHASDDGINAAVDEGDTTVPSVTITGGTVTVYSNSDGIDSNGTLDVTGGTVAVFINAPRDGDTTDVDRSGTLLPTLYVMSAVSADTLVAVGDSYSITTAADATSFCLMIPGITNGQSYTVTANGATLATVTATTAIQGMMMGGAGGAGGAGGGGFGGAPGGAGGMSPGGAAPSPGTGSRP